MFTREEKGQIEYTNLKVARKSFILISLFIFLILFSTVLMGNHALAEGGAVPGTLYQFDNPPGYGAVQNDNINENVYNAPPSGTPVPELPSVVDLSSDDWFPKIRSQIGGSCVAWSTVYYQFTYQAARLNNWDAKHDDSKVFSPKYVWNYLNGGRDVGVQAKNCYNLLNQQGCLRWSEFPQTNCSFEWFGRNDDSQTIASLRNALKTRISYSANSEFAAPQGSKTNSPVITSYDDPKLRQMKELINSGHPLTIYTYVNSFYTETLSNGERGCLYMLGNNGYHAMTIVGYDDNVYFDLNQDKTIQDYERGAFLVANSWGKSYGNDGFIWILYDALNKVSNVEDLQFSDRQPIIENNRYFHIEVANYTPQRMAEVTLEQKYRNDITVTLATSNDLASSKSHCKTFLNRVGGKLSFDGEDNGYQTCTFVFDYDTLYNGDEKVYWVEVTDNTAGNGANTTVKKIRWVDGNGKVLKTIDQQFVLNGKTEPYYYGIPVKSITLNKTSSTLYKGETEQLTATVLPENATEKKVTWKSSNPSVVQVDENGKVTCMGTGTATITATTKDGSSVSSVCTYRINDDYSDIPSKAFVVLLHSKISGIINTSGDVDYFRFTPTATGTYLIYTTGSIDTMGYLYDASENLLIQNDDASLSGRNFALQYTLEAGKTYYIKVKGYGTNTGAYTINISKDFYGASLASKNQDARRVQMQAEAATALTTLKITIGSKTYTLNRPDSGNLETTVNGARFKVTFVENNNGLSTIWKIEASIPATTTNGGDTVSFDFSKGKVGNVKSLDMSGFIAYGSAIKTGVDTRAEDSLKQLLAAMQQSGNTLTVRNGDNTLVNVTSTTKAATGMKIIETDRNGWITKIHYLVVFGDVIGGVVNAGDGLVDSKDALQILKSDVEISQLETLALLAADVDHDGSVTSKDALLINKYSVELEEIDQSYIITTVPDDCYYLDPVIF